MSPMTRATADSLRRSAAAPNSPSKPKIRKTPQRVGKSASATLRTGDEVLTTQLYGCEYESAELLAQKSVLIMALLAVKPVSSPQGRLKLVSFSAIPEIESTSDNRNAADRTIRFNA